MIFAVIGISHNGHFLFVHSTIDGNPNFQNLEAFGFIEELDGRHTVLGRIFEQDGASCHMTRRVIDWIEGNCDLLSNWDSGLPDLSSIEILWTILKDIVQKLQPQTIGELQAVSRASWGTLIRERFISFVRVLSIA
jgi:hypothetical protein